MNLQISSLTSELKILGLCLAAESVLADVKLNSCFTPFTATSEHEEGRELTTGVASHQWLRDHVVAGQSVFPAAAVVELGLAGALSTAPLPGRYVELVNLKISDFLNLEVNPSAVVVNTIRQRTGFSNEYNADMYWQQNASGETKAYVKRLRILTNVVDIPGLLDIGPAFQDNGEFDVNEFYAGLNRIGLNYGPLFRLVKSKNDHMRGASGIVSIGSLPQPQMFNMPPPVLDAAFHVLADHILALRFRGGHDYATFVPAMFGRIWFNPNSNLRTVSDLLVKVRIDQPHAATNGEGVLSYQLEMREPQGNLVLRITDGIFRKI